MKIKSVHKKLFPLLLGASLLLSGCGKEDPQKPETPAEPSTKTQEVTPATPDQAALDQQEKSVAEAMEAFGYVMCYQLQLGQGLNETEAKALAKGVEKFLIGEKPADNFQQKYFSGMMYLQQRMQEHQQKVTAENQKIADAKKPQVDAFFAKLDENPNIKKTESGLCYEILEPGDTDKTAKSGDQIEIHYKGTLIDGREFDSSYKTNEPVTFPVDEVIPGFSEGCKLIGEGGKVKLYIPSELGYGLNAPDEGIIEPGDPLIFEVELLHVIPATQAPTPEEEPTEQPVG
jgi:FKBP-type peptidyl-prolyl cis-trans isomerase